MNITGSPTDPTTPMGANRIMYWPHLDSPFKYMAPQEMKMILESMPRHESIQCHKVSVRPAIQPDLNTASSSDRALGSEVDQENENAQSEDGHEDEVITRQGHKRTQENMQSSDGLDMDEDADDKRVPKPPKRLKRSRKNTKTSGEEIKILSGTAGVLSSKQAATRRELKVSLRQTPQKN